MPGKLVLCRHGQSTWNLQNLFTGWTDVDLTEQGRAEAISAGREVRNLGFTIDISYTSVLKRAIRTLWLMLDEMDRMWIPVIRDWRLNERHYGTLQGLDKAETAAKYGADQVQVWRRSYSTSPPALDPDDERHPRHDPRYAGLAKPAFDGVPGEHARSRQTLLARAAGTGFASRQERPHRSARKQPSRIDKDARQNF